VKNPETKKLLEAAEIMEISAPLNFIEINKKYHALLKKWHPDLCTESRELCQEKTRSITSSFKTITNYIKNYKFSFAEKELNQKPANEDPDWWYRRFGSDQSWGPGK